MAEHNSALVTAAKPQQGGAVYPGTLRHTGTSEEPTSLITAKENLG